MAEFTNGSTTFLNFNERILRVTNATVSQSINAYQVNLTQYVARELERAKVTYPNIRPSNTIIPRIP